MRGSLQQRLRERERAPGVAGQQHALGQRRGRAQVDGRGAVARRTPAATLDCAAWERPSRRARVAEPETMPQRRSAAEPTLAQVAARAGVSPATVRRWVAQGPGARLRRPLDAGGRSPTCACRAAARARAHARADQARQRQRPARDRPDREPAERLGGRATRCARPRARAACEAALIERIYAAMGLGALPPEGLSDEDLRDDALRRRDARGGPSRRPPSCSSRASTGRRSRRSPTPRCA